MGQQQLLTLILASIMIGIAVAVAGFLFEAHNIESNKTAIISEIEVLSQHAAVYYMTPTNVGGGNRSFTGFRIPTALQSTPNAHYVATVNNQSIDFVATSAMTNTNIIRATLSNNTLSNWTFEGEFE